MRAWLASLGSGLRIGLWSVAIVAVVVVVGMRVTNDKEIDIIIAAIGALAAIGSMVAAFESSRAAGLANHIAESQFRPHVSVIARALQTQLTPVRFRFSDVTIFNVGIVPAVMERVDVGVFNAQGNWTHIFGFPVQDAVHVGAPFTKKLPELEGSSEEVKAMMFLDQISGIGVRLALVNGEIFNSIGLVEKMQMNIVMQPTQVGDLPKTLPKNSAQSL